MRYEANSVWTKVFRRPIMIYEPRYLVSFIMFPILLRTPDTFNVIFCIIVKNERWAFGFLLKINMEMWRHKIMYMKIPLTTFINILWVSLLSSDCLRLTETGKKKKDRLYARMNQESRIVLLLYKHGLNHNHNHNHKLY